jgi:hypothetical protein
VWTSRAARPGARKCGPPVRLQSQPARIDSPRLAAMTPTPPGSSPAFDGQSNVPPRRPWAELSLLEWLVLICVLGSLLLMVGMVGSTGEGSGCDHIAEDPARELCLRKEAKGLIPESIAGAGIGTAGVFLALRAARRRASRHRRHGLLLAGMGLCGLAYAFMLAVGVSNTSTPFGPYPPLDSTTWWQEFLTASVVGLLVGVLFPGGRRATPEGHPRVPQH